MTALAGPMHWPVTSTGFLDGAAPIALDELVAEAGLLTRTDRKYVLTADDFAALDTALAAAAPAARVLQIDGSREFGYRSLYFDTPALDGYVASGRRSRRRFKVRTRDYLDTGSRWIEIKTRGPRGTTVKERIPYVGEGVADSRLDASATEFVAGRLQARLINHDAATLHPVLETEYRRTTVFLPATATAASSRATIDTGLRWTDPADDTTLSLPELVIIETKGAATAGALDRVLWSHGHRPAIMSKYGVGLAALRPHLPAYKWRRILGGQTLGLAA